MANTEYDDDKNDDDIGGTSGDWCLNEDISPVGCTARPRIIDA